MSTKNKGKKENIIEETKDINELTPKELYDIKKAEKTSNKKKVVGPKKKKKKVNKVYQTNIAGRIFAVVMLLLMVASIAAYIFSYFK